MSPVPLRLKLTNDAIIFRTTNGERKRDNVVYTMELRWHEDSVAERVSGVGWSGPVGSGSPRHPEEVDEPFREIFRGLPPLPPPPPSWVKGRLWVGVVGTGVPLMLLLLLFGPCGSCG